MSKDPNDNKMIEDTDEIKIGNADIGKFNLVIYFIIIIACLIYLFTHFTR
jgi:hypothetical protein